MTKGAIAMPSNTIAGGPFRLALAIVVATAVAAAAAATGARSDDAPPGFKTIMSGLDNPRGLAMGPDGAIYVTEAGHGGSGPCNIMRGQTMCYGPTGAIAKLKKYVVTRVATGLPSYAPAGGNGAQGPEHVCFDKAGQMFVTYGLGMNPTLRPMLGAGGAYSGYLMRITKTGVAQPVVDVSGYEAADNPAGGPVDSNPYGLFCGQGGPLVTDAGGNSLFRVANGALSLLGVFPSRPSRATDAVPTTVTVGPDGAAYVGELTGTPFAVGAANVYRVAAGAAPQVYRSGFTAVMDIAFAADRTLYVLEHASGPGLSGPGVLLAVSPSGARTTVSSALDHPTALLIGRHGAIYVTNHGTTAGGGELLRLIG